MITASATDAINCTMGALAAEAETCFIRWRRTRSASWSKRAFSYSWPPKSLTTL